MDTNETNKEERAEQYWEANKEISCLRSCKPTFQLDQAAQENQLEDQMDFSDLIASHRLAQKRKAKKKEAMTNQADGNRNRDRNNRIRHWVKKRPSPEKAPFSIPHQHHLHLCTGCNRKRYPLNKSRFCERCQSSSTRRCQ